MACSSYSICHDLLLLPEERVRPQQDSSLLIRRDVRQAGASWPLTFTVKRYVGRDGGATTFRMLAGWSSLLRAWHLVQVRCLSPLLL